MIDYYALTGFHCASVEDRSLSRRTAREAQADPAPFAARPYAVAPRKPAARPLEVAPRVEGASEPRRA